MTPLEQFAAKHVPGNASWIAAVLVALVLVWRVVVSGSAPLLDSNPSAGPARAATPFPIEAPDAPWRARLARNPTDYPSLVILAQHLERQGKIDEAREAMSTAMRMAPADERTLVEAAGFNLRLGNELQALRILRTAVELNPTAAGTTWLIFVAALDGGRREAFFADAARDGPLWWPGFFVHACQVGRDVDALQRVFAVRAAAASASVGERACMIERLERENRWSEAYQSWINSLPGEQRRRIPYVFNGDFDLPISNIGFDWIIAPQDGVNVDAQSIQGSRGRRALRIEFVRKRWARSPVQQTLMLFPGKYRLEGRGRADGLDTWLGVQWGLRCVTGYNQTSQLLATSERFRGTSDWVAFHDDFTVGPDCPVQVLRLELADPRPGAAPTENVVTRINGNVWFDDFRVRSLD